MNIEELMKEINNAKERISADEEFIRESKQKIAEHLCPFKVGDLVISPSGEKEQIASISPSGWGTISYDFMIHKITRSGVPYKNKNHAYSVEKYKAFN